MVSAGVSGPSWANIGAGWRQQDNLSTDSDTTSLRGSDGVSAAQSAVSEDSIDDSAGDDAGDDTDSEPDSGDVTRSISNFHITMALPSEAADELLPEHAVAWNTTLSQLARKDIIGPTAQARWLAIPHQPWDDVCHNCNITHY